MKAKRIQLSRDADAQAEAEKCAASFWATRTMCGGCHLSSVCPLNSWFKDERSENYTVHELHRKANFATLGMRANVVVEFDDGNWLYELTDYPMPDLSMAVLIRLDSGESSVLIGNGQNVRAWVHDLCTEPNQCHRFNGVEVEKR